MARDASSSLGPDFEHWESPETRIRWERGLALIGGMILVVLVFFFLVSALPLSPEREPAPLRGLQATVTPALVAQTVAAPAAPAAPLPAEQRLSAVSRAFPNVRRAPVIDPGNIAMNLRQGQRVEVVGRTADGQWLQILNPDNSRERLWVSADMLEVTGNIGSLPVARAE